MECGGRFDGDGKKVPGGVERQRPTRPRATTNQGASLLERMTDEKACINPRQTVSSIAISSSPGLLAEVSCWAVELVANYQPGVCRGLAGDSAPAFPTNLTPIFHYDDFPQVLR